jgi:hypothetical protein
MKITSILKRKCNSMHYFKYLLWETTLVDISDRNITSAKKLAQKLWLLKKLNHQMESCVNKVNLHIHSDS